MEYQRVKYHRWTTKDLLFVKKNYKTMLNRDIAEALGVPVRGVESKARLMGIQRKNAKKGELPSRMTKKEKSVIDAFHGERSLSEIARFLRRSVSSVHRYVKMHLSDIDK